MKSDQELCNDIREFVSAVGLSEGHLPSMKELSEHGRFLIITLLVAMIYCNLVKIALLGLLL